MAERVATPLVHTLHRPFDDQTAALYAAHAPHAWVVPISRAQLADAPPGLRLLGPIPNPLTLAEWPAGGPRGDHLVWLGRVDPEKGPDVAISAARRAGRDLVLAGPVQPAQQGFFDAHVAPLLDAHARYVGEVGAIAKRRLLAGAAGLLMPIRWPEPFGMVMIEAMACGTPVIAFRAGAAPEIVVDGRTGFVVDDERGMVDAIARLPDVDRRVCRAHVASTCDTPRVAAAYERAFRTAIAGSAGAGGTSRDAA